MSKPQISTEVTHRTKMLAKIKRRMDVTHSNLRFRNKKTGKIFRRKKTVKPSMKTVARYERAMRSLARAVNLS